LEQDDQFLTAKKTGKSATIAGQLRFPQGASGRLPAVILQHGSGGLNAGHELWSKHFNEIGVTSVLLDSFSGRGLTSTSTNQALLGRLNMILDAYRAFDVLANHPRIERTEFSANFRTILDWASQPVASSDSYLHPGWFPSR